MGYSWVLSVRSVIVTYFSIGGNWLLKINWKTETFLIVYLFDNVMGYSWVLSVRSVIDTYIIYFFLDCNGTDVLVRAIWVSIWLLVPKIYKFKWVWQFFNLILFTIFNILITTKIFLFPMLVYYTLRLVYLSNFISLNNLISYYRK